MNRAAQGQNDKMLLELAETVARRIALQSKEKRVKQALGEEAVRIRQETREILLSRRPSSVAPRQQREKRAASAPALQPKPKRRSDPQLAEEDPRAPDQEPPHREEETVDEQIERLKRAGILDENIQMEVEMRFDYFAKQGAARLKSTQSGKGRRTLQAESEEEQREYEDWSKEQIQSL